MSKKTPKQKPAAASSVIVKRPLSAAGSRKTAATDTGPKRTMPQSKSDRVLSLLKQAGGSTLHELMKATGWQAHSVRGFLSGSVRKQKGLTVLSQCDGAGIRRYRIEEGQEA